MTAHKEIDRFCINDINVIVTEDGNDVILTIEGYLLDFDNRFKANTPREELEAAAELLVNLEKGRGL